MKKILFFLSFLITLSVAAQVGDKYKPVWITETEADTVTIDYKKGQLHKITLTRSIAFKFINLVDGCQIRLSITHSTAGTIITNLPNRKPWDFNWSSNAGDVTNLIGDYDLGLDKFNWTYTTSIAASTPIISTHDMLAFWGYAYPSGKAYMDTLKVEGFNNIWAYGDEYTYTGNNYAAKFKQMMDTANIVGISVMPGISSGTVTEMMHMILDLKDHPAIYRRNGVPVFNIYYYREDVWLRCRDSLIAHGVPRSAYIVTAHMLAPIPNGSGGWIEYAGNLTSTAAANHIWDVNSAEGIVNFAVDKGSSTDNTVNNQIILENSINASVGKARGKIVFAGINSIYTSAQYTDLGYWGPYSQMMAILSLPVALRPDGIMETTMNDYKERSYMSRSQNLFGEYGALAFIPALSLNFTFGPNISCYPTADHSGMNKFLKPLFDAYKNRDVTFTITTDRIFVKHAFHPRTAPHTTVIPPVFAGRADITPTWWNASPFMVTPTWASGGLLPGYDSICVAVHLTAPAQIKINSTTSATTFSAGIAFFSIPIALGTVRVAIVRGGVEVLVGTSPQTIVNETYPGGYSEVEIQLAYNRRIKIGEYYLSQVFENKNKNHTQLA